ncbi:MAG: hypothetical protein COA66_04350 [Arcobacter sp.]|nr:MAG: hypothetical protein COA66_04350 [Arcobacter sp.]
MLLDYSEESAINKYKLMSDTVVPRPIAWIVTQENGVINAAPFSYFIPLSSSPATVIVSIGHKEDGSQKDSLSNILKNKKATICFVNKNNVKQAALSATSLGNNESEIEKYEIEVNEVLEDYPPMISSSQSALFCDYYSTVELPGKTVPIILEIKKQYIQDDRIDERYHINVDNIGRVGAKFKAMVDL